MDGDSRASIAYERGGKERPRCAYLAGEPGAFSCTHAQVHTRSGRVEPARHCAACRFAVTAEGEAIAPVERIAAERTKRGPCAYQGERVGRRPCTSCPGGRTQLFEFACLHEAHAGEKVSPAQECQRCADFLPVTIAGADDAAGQNTSQRVLLRLSQGLGDAVQLTTVLLHLAALRPRWSIDVACRPGQESLFAGLARRVFAGFPDAGEHYEIERVLPWHEPERVVLTGDRCTAPSTKAEKCLREVFGIEPIEKLCRYQVTPAEEAEAWCDWYCGDVLAGAPFALIHYQGSSFSRSKNIDERAVAAVCRELIARGVRPVILDWARTSGLRGGAGITCADELPGDGGTIAALAGRASLLLGIDSGPGHVFGAVQKTPAVIVWTRHHPLHYFGLADHVTHVVHGEHGKHLRGSEAERAAGADYFARHYRHVVLDKALERALPAIVAEVLGRGGACPGTFRPIATAGGATGSSGTENEVSKLNSGLLFTGGIGDFFTVESFLSPAERGVTRLVWATRQRRAIQEMLLARPDVLPHVREHVIAWDDFSASERYCFVTLPEVQLAERAARPPGAGTRIDWRGVRDASIARVFAEIHSGARTFAPSAWLRGDARISPAIAAQLPARFAVVCPEGADTRWLVWVGRAFDVGDWKAAAKMLAARGLAGVVLGAAPGDLPRGGEAGVDGAWIDLRGQTTLAEAITILRGAEGYVGVDTALSVLAAQIAAAHRDFVLTVKTRNTHCRNHAACYFAPWREFPFLVRGIAEGFQTWIA